MPSIIHFTVNTKTINPKDPKMNPQITAERRRPLTIVEVLYATIIAMTIVRILAA